MENIPISKMMIKLKSSDGEVFDVPLAVAMQSKTISYVIEDRRDDMPIPLYNVSAEILKKVIDYCTQHVTAADESESDTAGHDTSITPAPARMSEEELTNWDRQFLDVDMGTLYNLMLAAHYLETDRLLQMTTKKVVAMIKGNTLEEMREIFKIKNDFTAEEEEQIHREFPWAFNK